MLAMTQLYTGGPAVAGFTGRNLWVVDDTANLAVGNDAANLLAIWCNRIFGLRELDILLPSNSVGAETILDSNVS